MLKMARQRLRILLASYQMARLSMKVVLRFLGDRHMQVRRLFKYIETILHRASRFESNRDEAKQYENLLFDILSSMKNNSIGVNKVYREFYALVRRVKSLSKRMRSEQNQESDSQHTTIVASGVMTDISGKYYLDMHDFSDYVVKCPISLNGFSSSQLYLPFGCPDVPFEPEWVDPHTLVPRMMQQHHSNYEVIGCGVSAWSASMVVHSTQNYSMLPKQPIAYFYCIICFVEMVPLCTYSEESISLTTNHSSDVQLVGYDDPFEPVMVELLP